MRYKKILFLLLIVVLALILVWTFFLPDIPRIIVLHNPDVKETVYTLEDKSLSLTTDDRENSEHYLSLRSKSKLPIQEQVAILSVMLDKIPKERRFRTFHIDRLINAFGEDRSLSERLTLAAAKSPLWKQKILDPRVGQGFENNIVRDIANQALIYPELKEMFARHGYEIRIAYVEKILIDPQTKLPFDCITWFSLSRPLTPIAKGYWKDDEKVYWKWRTIEEPKGPAQYTVKEVKGADPKTFAFLAERIEGVWGKDRSGIYFFELKIEGADIATWQPLDWGYSKDKEHVYKGAQRVKNANPKTFIVPSPPR